MFYHQYLTSNFLSPSLSHTHDRSYNGTQTAGLPLFVLASTAPPTSTAQRAKLSRMEAPWVRLPVLPQLQQQAAIVQCI